MACQASWNWQANTFRWLTRKGVLTVWSAGARVLEIEKRPRSQESVTHPEQWSGVASVSQTRRAPAPLAHQKSTPEVVSRPLVSVRSVLWNAGLAGDSRMKKGAYKQLNLSHLETALPQVLERARAEQ
jgi:hypothetical protein